MIVPGTHGSPIRRMAVGVLAAIQLAMFATLPVADALLDAQETGTSTHIEAQGSDHGCATGHDHFLCQVARSLGEVKPGTLVNELVDVGGLFSPQAVPSNDQTPSYRALIPRQGPRAPPTL